MGGAKLGCRFGIFSHPITVKGGECNGKLELLNFEKHFELYRIFLHGEIGARLIRERRHEREPELKKLTSDRETPASPIKGNDIFIIEINCRLTARHPRVIKGRMAAAGRIKLKF